MYPEKLNNSPSFGWTAPTHGRFIEKSMSDSGLPNYVKTLLEKGAQNEELAELARKSKPRFVKVFENFLNFLGIGCKLSPEEKYISHCQNFKKLLMLGKPNQALEEAGKALRYLHEISNPNILVSNHVNKKSNVENLASKTIDTFTMTQNEKIHETYVPRYKFVSNTLKDLFKEVSIAAKRGKTSVNQNSIDNQIISENQNISLAVDATSKFLQLIGLC